MAKKNGGASTNTLDRKKARTKNIAVEALKHKESKRRYIPTAELESVVPEADKAPIRLAYERRNRDLDPQLVWRGKDQQDWSDLVVQAPPLYVQEKVHPEVLVNDLIRQSKLRKKEDAPAAPDLFADFNGLPDEEARAEFYKHDANWSNRMILGDSLQAMASLAEREGLKGQVQCIYISTRPTASSSTPTFNGPPPAATWRTAKSTTSRASPRGEGLPRHLARRHPLLSHLFARPSHRRP
jgi:hypothetical protein